MKTGNIQYLRGIYELKQENNLKTVKDFELINTEVKEHCTLFTKKIRIEKDNGFHLRSRYFNYWLYLRNESNWKRCHKSGLAITDIDNVFEGNISQPVILKNKSIKGRDFENPKHLIVGQTLDSWRTFVLDIFPDFYPVRKSLLQGILNEHTYLLRIKKGA